MFPPLKQILGALPFGPVCCTMRVSTITVLGTLQIMVGLFNIGLGPGRTSTHPGDLTHLGAAYWLGAVFIASGITSLLLCPSTCWIIFTAIGNIVGAIFSIVAVALYVIDLQGASPAWMCNNPETYNDCLNVAYFAEKLLMGMDITLIVFAFLQLGVCITITVFCILGLTRRNKDQVEADSHQSMLNQVTTRPGS